MTGEPLDPSVHPDELLVGRARAGDRGAFEELVNRHLEAARRYCERLLGDRALAEDAAQEAFLKAWRALGSFRGDSAFRTWLWRIVANAASDMRKPRMAALDEETEIAAVPERDVAAEDAVRRAIAALPERQKRVLLMKVELDMTPQEIADALGISYESAKSNLSLARKRMKELLE